MAKTYKQKKIVIEDLWCTQQIHAGTFWVFHLSLSVSLSLSSLFLSLPLTCRKTSSNNPVSAHLLCLLSTTTTQERCTINNTLLLETWAITTCKYNKVPMLSALSHHTRMSLVVYLTTSACSLYAFSCTWWVIHVLSIAITVTMVSVVVYLWARLLVLVCRASLSPWWISPL